MARKSTVAMQDDAILQEVHALIRRGRTINEITEALKALGADVSRSATARYVKSERESMRQMVKAQTMARAWVEEFGKEPDGDVAGCCRRCWKPLRTAPWTIWPRLKPPRPRKCM